MTNEERLEQLRKLKDGDKCYYVSLIDDELGYDQYDVIEGDFLSIDEAGSVAFHVEGDGLSEYYDGVFAIKEDAEDFAMDAVYAELRKVEKRREFLRQRMSELV